MVGHLLEYHPAVDRLKALLDEGELGELYYVYGNRLNLGKLRADENALWSLGAHDVSVILRLIGEEPDECVAHGRSYVREGVEDVVFCYLRFPSGTVAHLHLSLAGPPQGAPPHRRRRAAHGDLRRHAPRGQAHPLRQGLRPGRALMGRVHRALGGDLLPQIPTVEPLRVECEHFVECIRTGATPRSDGRCGLRVVRVLERLQRSLEA